MEVIVEYNAKDEIIEIYYLVDGQLHREDGPASIWYDEDGTICWETYFFNNTEVSFEEWQQYIAKKKLEQTLDQELVL